MNAALQIRAETAARFLGVGEHVIDIDTLRVLTRPGEPRLTPKAAAVLLHLARSAGRTLSRDELLNEVWKGTCPTPDVLTQAVKDLRRTLGDDLNAPRFVETLPRLGYRLIASTRLMDRLDTADLPRPAAQVASRVPDAATPPPGRRSRERAAWALAAIAAIGVTAVSMRRESGVGAELKPRWHADHPRAITSDPGPENFPRISPDGTRIAYSVGDPEKHDARIVQRSLTQSRVVGLTQPAPGEEIYPVWSPDGSTIAFARHVGDDCEIVLVPALGGLQRQVDQCFTGAVNYFSWAPDGAHLITTMPSTPAGADMAIALLPVDGGPKRYLSYAHGSADLDLDARYSPDGTRIAFRRGASPYSDLFVMNADGSDVRQLTHLASRMRGFDWTRDGSALIFSSGHAGPQALYTVSLSDGRIEALGVQPAEFPSASRQSDTVVYEIPRMRTQLAWVALGADGDTAVPSAEQHALAASTGNDGAPTFSPIDDRLAFVSDRSGAQQLWLDDPSSGETYPLTDGNEPTLRYPVWRPDGERILITARGASSGSLIEIDIATRSRRVLSTPDDDIRYGVYGPTPGTYVAVVGDSGKGRELIQFRYAGGRQTDRLVLARDVARIDYDRADATVYFTKVAEAGLYRFDARSGEEQLVSRRINPAHLDGWLVLAGKIYYIEARAVGPSAVHELDPATGADTIVASIPGSLADFNFSVSHDRTRIVMVRVAAEDNDIGAISLRHGDAG